MTILEKIDPKLIDKVKKLLNLARCGGATEAEADLAMERAEAILRDNNLSMAMVEASGGSASESRLKQDGIEGANYRWARVLMEAIAESAFCDVSVKFKRVANRHGYRDAATGYELIGRVSNVVAARNMFEYLMETIARFRRDYRDGVGNNNAKSALLFGEGMAARLTVRVKERHRVALREQREKAEAEAKARAANGNGSTSNALVVILEDYAQTERWANADIRHGYPVGTTKAREEERARIAAERTARMNALQKEGLSWDEAYYVVYCNMTVAQAKARWAAEKAAQEARESSGTKERTYRYRKTREDYLRERDARAAMTSSYQEGASAADSVSLSDQIARKSNKMIGG